MTTKTTKTVKPCGCADWAGCTSCDDSLDKDPGRTCKHCGDFIISGGVCERCYDLHN